MKGINVLPFYKSSQKFHRKFVKNFNPKLSKYKFNKMRQIYLNLMNSKINPEKYEKLDLEIIKFLQSNKNKYNFINILQIAFNIWGKIDSKVETRNEIFIFFFYASFYYLSNRKKINSVFVKRALNLIKVTSPKEKLFNPVDLIENYYEGKKYADNIYNWLDYGISEYEVYKKFDLFIITLSSIYLASDIKGKKTLIFIINLLNNKIREDVQKKVVNCTSLLKTVFAQ